MTAPIVQVQYDTLEDVTKRFDDRAGDTSVMIRGLVSAVDQLRGGAWGGEAATSFYREMDEEIFPTLERLEEAFVSAGQFTGFVIDTAQTAEQEAANQFQTSESNMSKSNASESDESELEGAGGTKSDGDIRVTDTYTVEGVDHRFKADDKENDIHPNDVAQGSGIADCYVLTPMAAIASRNPELIRNAIEPNGDGTYTVTLYKKNDSFIASLFGGDEYVPVEIIVTAEFPKTTERYVVDKDTGIGEWVSTGGVPGPGNFHAQEGDAELWPRLIEKAYGQMITGSDDLDAIYTELPWGDPSHVLTAMTGQPTTNLAPSDFLNAEDIETRLNDGETILLSSFSSDSDTSAYYEEGNLTRKHSYWIESVTDDGTAIIRNGWGYPDDDPSVDVENNIFRVEIPISELDDNFRMMRTNSVN